MSGNLHMTPTRVQEEIEYDGAHRASYAMQYSPYGMSTTHQSSAAFDGSYQDDQNSAPFYAQLSALQPHQAQMKANGYPPVAYSTRQNPGTSSSAFHMGHMASALPSQQPQTTQYQLNPIASQALQQQQQQAFATHSNPTLSKQTFHSQQASRPTDATQPMYNSSMPMNGDQSQYYAAYPPHMYGASPYLTGQQMSVDPSMYGPSTYDGRPVYSPGMKANGHRAYPQLMHYQQQHAQNYHRHPHEPSRGYFSSTGYSTPQNSPEGQSLLDDNGIRGTLPAEFSRGPPRKPKQSGHALWVGNLSPGVSVIDLKDHFSCGFTQDIESIKLISKSNCAFVNYRTEASCITAMNRFHDSRLLGTRLVCRLRKSLPTPPHGSAYVTADPWLENLPDGIGDMARAALDTSEHQDRRFLPERFFVLKSLTLSDLEISARTGVWATQAHNEEVLNDAFEHAENVYLIFSANKSGEYFGYARMTSAVTLDSGPGEPVSTGSISQSTSLTEIENPLSAASTHSHSSIYDTGPKTILTPATQWAPKGKIIDDNVRGTIFWEADGHDESPQISRFDGILSKASSPETSKSPENFPVIASSTSRQQDSPTDQGLEKSTSADESIGTTSMKHFKVEWISTRRVPFYKTRALRNAWNSNREVKIARDGTELETEVGKRMLGLFGPPLVRGM